MKKVMIYATPEEIAKGLRMFLAENSVEKQNKVSEFEDDRISKKQAAELAGISIPTLSKYVAQGRFKEHSIGHHLKYFLKSEIIESLRNNG